MPDFAYTARSTSGQATTGVLTADSMAQALQSIRSEGKFPVSIRPVDRSEADAISPSLPNGGLHVSRAEIIQFSQQLAMMIETGVTLSEALECIARQIVHPRYKLLVEDISQHIQSGVSFSEALARHPRSFPVLYVSLMRASEKTGQMSMLLNRATTYLKEEQDTRRKVTGAMIYPSIMMGFVILTTVFLLSFVLPRFTAIYRMKNAALPLPTQVVMAISHFITGYWIWLITGVAASIGGIMFALRTPRGARAWHYVQLNVPLIGALYRKVHLAQGLRIVGTMAGAGVALMDCVGVAQDLCPNTYFRDLWRRIADQIQAGRQLSDPLFDSELVPRPVAQMIFSGEKGGRLGAVMEQVAGFAEQELKEQIGLLTRYIEPAMIILMGMIIGGICLALLLPIFTISKVIGR